MKFPTLFSMVTVHNSWFGFLLSTTMHNLQEETGPASAQAAEEHVEAVNAKCLLEKTSEQAPE